MSLDFTSGLAEYLRGGHVVLAYALLAVTTAPPLVPNAVLLVTGGVLAAEGRLNLALVLLVVAGSAVAGDLLIHRTGHAVSGRVLRRMRRKPRQSALLKWAALRIERHGVPFVIAVRFLPSGRVIGGLAAGVVRYPARRYAIGAGVAEAVWASYSVGAGYFSGRAASNDLYALTLGVGMSILVAGMGTAVQWISRARERRLADGAGESRRPGVAASLAAWDSGVATPIRTLSAPPVRLPLPAPAASVRWTPPQTPSAAGARPVPGGKAEAVRVEDGTTTAGERDSPCEAAGHGQ